MGELVISRTALEQRVVQLEQQIVELHHSTGRLRRASGQIESEYETTALLRGPVYAATGTESARFIGGGNALTTPAPTGGGHGFDDLEFDRYTEFHRLTREMAEATSDSLAVRTELENLLGDFDSLLNRQRRLANDVQESVMRMRMVPLRTLATRLHRTVRVTADRQGKQAELVLEGDTLELDSQVLDSMGEPLLHMLRNSVGHGLETPDVRRSLRKPARGRVWLSAYHEGTQAVLRVRDDGRGLDAEQLRKKAVSGGFLSADRAAALSDADVMSLVFLQGLSTADKVTDVSGRGVGMDIVRDTVQKLRGTISIDSTPNEGTSFTIRLPLTLAVIRALDRARARPAVRGAAGRDAADPPPERGGERADDSRAGRLAQQQAAAGGAPVGSARDPRHRGFAEQAAGPHRPRRRVGSGAGRRRHRGRPRSRHQVARPPPAAGARHHGRDDLRRRQRGADSERRRSARQARGRAGDDARAGRDGAGADASATR